MGTELQTLRGAGPGCAWGQERRPAGPEARGQGPDEHGEQLQGEATISHHPTQDTSGVEGCRSSHGPGTGSKEQGCPRIAGHVIPTQGHVVPWSLALTQSTLAVPWRLLAGGLGIGGAGLAWGRELALRLCGGGELSLPGPRPLVAGDAPAGLCPRPPAAGPWTTPLPRTEMDLTVAKGGNEALLRTRRP